MQLNRMTISRKLLKYHYNRLSARFDKPINALLAVTDTVSAVAALVSLIALTVCAGYDLLPRERHVIVAIVNTCRALISLNIVFNFVFRFREMMRRNHRFRLVLDELMVLSCLPMMMHIPHEGLLSVILSRKVLWGYLALYSVIEICYTTMRIVNRRTNPSLILGTSFIAFIIIGSLALMLPKCTYGEISYFDSLFVSTSAVCICGLSSVDIGTTFTPMGIGVISILVQLGSLGIISFTSFFALFFTGNTSIYNQLLLRDVVYSKSMNSLIPTLLYILGFTLAVELAGAVAVFFTIPDALGLDFESKLMFSAFHSMSSFCNAGFSFLPGGMSNPALMQSSQWIYGVTSVLIFAGALGFPILMNFKDIITRQLHDLWQRLRGGAAGVRKAHIYDVNTKLVLVTTLSILVLGSVSFFILEYNNTLRGMPAGTKVVQSVFNSLIPRSAGFASVNPAAFLDVTLVLVLVQMVIGGSSQSMAGGIKVNTLGTVLLTIRSVLSGHKGTTAFGRTVSQVSVRRAFAVLTLGIIALLFYTVALMLLEPGLPAKSLVFESVSALFTVGSSLGITGALSAASKTLLCTAMFIGRVGIVSLLCGFFGGRPDRSSHYPVDNVIIN